MQVAESGLKDALSRDLVLSSPVDSSDGGVEGRSPGERWHWGGFQGLPASQLHGQPAPQDESRAGRTDGTLSVIHYFLAYNIQLHVAER